MYTEEIWTDLTYDEKQIYKIYEAYQKAMRNRGDTKKYLKQATAKSFPDIDRDGLMDVTHSRDTIINLCYLIQDKTKLTITM
jgi:hypothetical protein